MNKKSNRLHSSQKNAMLRARNHEQIRSYFEQVLKLRNSGDPFPVDLDDAWPLTYSRKDNAVRILINKFIEGKEYISQDSDNHRFRQKAEIKDGGDLRTIKYKLSVSCMEFLIAREDKAIFEVYQQVFHLTVEANTPIAGVFPILYQGKVYYPYNQLLRAIGYSGRSGSVQKRKRQYSGCFIKAFGINFITPEFVEILTKQRELLVMQQNMKLKQLELLFQEEQASIHQ